MDKDTISTLECIVPFVLAFIAIAIYKARGTPAARETKWQEAMMRAEHGKREAESIWREWISLDEAEQKRIAANLGREHQALHADIVAYYRKHMQELAKLQAAKPSPRKSNRHARSSPQSSRHAQHDAFVAGTAMAMMGGMPAPFGIMALMAEEEDYQDYLDYDNDWLDDDDDWLNDDY